MDANRIGKLLWPLCLMYGLWQPITAEATVLLVVPSYSPASMSLVNKINQEIRQDIDVKQLADIASIDQSLYQAVVLVGETVVAQWQPSNLPTLAVLISRAHYRTHAAKLTSGVYSEPSLIQQLMLAQAVLGSDSAIGVLFASQAQRQRSDLTPALSTDLNLYVQTVDSSDSLYHALQDVLKHSRVLVGVYDPELYSSENIKRILISAYRQNQPLIGPSAAYVRAGAIASVYSTGDDVAKRLAEILKFGLITKRWPAPDYNPYLHVQVNAQVARSLNMELPSAAELAQQVAALLAKYDLPSQP